MPDNHTNWLTQESYDRLNAELVGLKENRPVLAAEINERREEGDLKENGGYHAAKEEQGKNEARVRQLTQLLQNAKVGDAPADDGVVEPGMLVTAVVAGEEETFLLGSREIAASGDLDVYSEASPLGQAIIGLKVGDKASYEAPNGRSITVEVTGANAQAIKAYMFGLDYLKLEPAR